MLRRERRTTMMDLKMHSTYKVNTTYQTGESQQQKKQINDKNQKLNIASLPYFTMASTPDFAHADGTT